MCVGKTQVYEYIKRILRAEKYWIKWKNRECKTMQYNVPVDEIQNQKLIEKRKQYDLDRKEWS